MGPTTNKLMQFFSVMKRIDGRIKLQKIIYILQQKGVDFDLDFKYALYGPYSEDLQLEIDFLADISFLEERKDGANNYVYFLNEAFKPKLKVDKQTSGEFELANFLVSKESQLLEVTATIYYLKNKKYDDERSICEKIKSLKPNLSNKVSEAFQLNSNIEKRYKA